MYRLCGAGVLPFRVSPTGGVHFLLGRESYASGWSGSGKISAFEGGTERHDEQDDVENAVREFVEESLGVLCDRPEDSSRLATELRSGEFALRVCTRDTRRLEEHCTFVKQYEWSGSIEQVFKDRRAALLSIRERGKRMAELDRMIPHTYPCLRHDDTVHWNGERFTVVDAHAHVAHGMLHIRWRLKSSAEGTAAHPENRSARTVTRTVSFGPVDTSPTSRASCFVELLELRHSIAQSVAALPKVLHTALNLELSSGGALLRVAVRHEWLEKCCVHEYSAEKLTEALRETRHSFRPYFALMVRQVLAQFADLAPPESIVHV